MAIIVSEADPARDEIAPLLAAHLAYDAASPPESRHALGADALRAPDVAFWIASFDDATAAYPIGMIALKDLAAVGMPGQGEVKSMHVLPAGRGAGVADSLLDALIARACAQGFVRLNLETGSTEPFARARAFYRRRGFAECGPFAGYREDRYSVFMTRPMR